MTPAEFREIVTAWGGPEKFARMIQARPRVVYAYLSGERRIRPTLAFLFSQLVAPPQPTTKKGETDE